MVVGPLRVLHLEHGHSLHQEEEDLAGDRDMAGVAEVQQEGGLQVAQPQSWNIRAIWLVGSREGRRWGGNPTLYS